MDIQHFTGFAGTRLTAEIIGDPDDPVVLMLHSAGQTRAVWRQTAEFLAKAGRRVINLDLRGHGDSEWPSEARYDIDAFALDLRAVLSQLQARPVIVAARLGGWSAICALQKDAATLASGLILVDLPSQLSQEHSLKLRTELKQKLKARGENPNWDIRMLDHWDASYMPERLTESAPNIKIPVSFIRGALMREENSARAHEFVKLLPEAEFSEIDDASLALSEDRLDEFNGLLINFLERKHPRQSPEYRSGSDARTFRDAMGCFATGITVVTALDRGGAPIGITVNSFTSLSLDPPLLLVCIGKASETGVKIKEAECFAINVLQIGQQPTSNLFATRGADRFAEADWEMGEMGAPVLNGSLGSFECERHAVHDGGDHVILVGKVLKATFESRRDPLLYFRGKYRRLHFG